MLTSSSCVSVLPTPIRRVLIILVLSIPSCHIVLASETDMESDGLTLCISPIPGVSPVVIVSVRFLA